MTKIGISFKESERDLYEYLKKQMSASIFIKQLIKEKMESEGSEKEKPQQISNNRKKSQIIV